MNRPGPTSSSVRWRGLGIDAMLLAGGRMVAAVCGLIQVPVALAYLGAEAFGLWMALGGLLGVAAVLDGGLGFALQNRLARAAAGNRPGETSALLRFGLRWLALFGSGVLLLGLVLAWKLPWAEWLGVADPALRAQTPAAIALVVAAAAVTLPVSLAGRIASARQETWRLGVWSMIGSLTGLALIFWGVHRAWPLLAFVAATASVPIVLNVGLAVHLLAATRDETTPAAVPIQAASLLRESVFFLLPQLGAVFIGAFLPTLIALFAGASAVAAFSVLQRLYGLVLQLQMLSLQPTWPAYTHATERHDAAGARKIFRASLLASAAAALILLLLVPLTPPVLRLWLGESVPTYGPALVWAIFGWHALQALGQPGAMLLNGTGRNASMAVAGWITILVALALCTRLGPAAGAVGIVVALIIPYATINLPVVAIASRRALADIDAGTPSR